MEMEQDVIQALLEAFEQSDWQEMTVSIGGDRLHVSRRTEDAAPPMSAGNAPGASATATDGTPASPASAPDPASASTSAPPAESAETEVPSPAPENLPEREAQPPDGVTVTSPSVGLFWRAPAPGAPPFVDIGGLVSMGDTVAIVEVMKLMNHVTAPVAGTVVAILPENGGAVEFGQVLIVIDPGE